MTGLEMNPSGTYSDYFIAVTPALHAADTVTDHPAADHRADRR